MPGYANRAVSAPGKVPGNLVKAAAKAAQADNPRVAVCGECVGFLCSEGNTNAAIRIEKAGNDLMKNAQHRHPLRVSNKQLSFDRDKPAFRNICAEHSTVHFR